jgi:hypothetical protein
MSLGADESKELLPRHNGIVTPPRPFSYIRPRQNQQRIVPYPKRRSGLEAGPANTALARRRESA